jgi:hypothetical protein
MHHSFSLIRPLLVVLARAAVYVRAERQIRPPQSGLRAWPHRRLCDPGTPGQLLALAGPLDPYTVAFNMPEAVRSGPQAANVGDGRSVSESRSRRRPPKAPYPPKLVTTKNEGYCRCPAAPHALRSRAHIPAHAEPVRELCRGLSICQAKGAPRAAAPKAAPKAVAQQACGFLVPSLQLLADYLLDTNVLIITMAQRTLR